MATYSEYDYSLDEASAKKAMVELNEDPDEKDDALESFREWVEEHQYITAPTDDNFLLRFLRCSKFSMLRAQKLLEAYCTVRTSPKHGVPKWFQRQDMDDPVIIELIDTAFFVPLPERDSEGRKIVVCTGNYDPRVVSMDDVMRAAYMCVDIMLMDEKNQVNGFIYLLDCSHWTLSHVAYWTPTNLKKFVRAWQDVYPMIFQGSNYWKLPTIMDRLFDVIRYFMSESNRKMVVSHGHDFDRLHKVLPKSALPEEYGGTAGTMKELCQKWKEEMYRNVKEFTKLECISFNEAAKPPAEFWNASSEDVDDNIEVPVAPQVAKR
ncbi:clavesin-1-like [Tubulanus polymorphus]|uniref:clavesin-1-like n=1 Tax=Tubulanus polymorphus TaxID=672921 RepID=UPI003DA53B8F